jgi:hypothetical protein
MNDLIAVEKIAQWRKLKNDQALDLLVHEPGLAQSAFAAMLGANRGDLGAKVRGMLLKRKFAARNIVDDSSRMPAQSVFRERKTSPACGCLARSDQSVESARVP